MTEGLIYIPTYGRVDDQLTVSYLSPTWRNRYTLVARPEEVAALRSRGYVVMECPVQGIGATRQWILEQHDVDLLGEHIVMMDDDLRFYRRRVDDPTKFLRLTPGSTTFDVMMDCLLALLTSSHPVAGLAGRSGANRATEEVRRNCRMYDVHALNVPVVREQGWRMDRLRFMEDFDFHLQVLTDGYETRMLNLFCKDDRGSQTPGGCSGYRTMTGQEEAARKLADTWPAFVKTRQVKAKGEGEWATRTDVTVQWKQAAEFGRAEHLL